MAAPVCCRWFLLLCCLSFLRNCAVADAPLWASGAVPHTLLPLAGEQRPVIIEPRAHSAWFVDLDLPEGADPFLLGKHGAVLPDRSSQQHAVEVARVHLAPHGAAKHGTVQEFLRKELGSGNVHARRCDRCNLRRAVRGRSNARKQWTVLLCKVCVDASGNDARKDTMLLNGRCRECTRVAAFGPQHGCNKLVLPASGLLDANSTITFRSVAQHCKLHRAPGEVDVKHARCNWPGGDVDSAAVPGGASERGAGGGPGTPDNAGWCGRQPNWGPPGGKPLRCSRHRAPSHINLLARLCIQEGCRKHAGYGDGAQGPAGARYCAAHRLPWHINLKTRPCLEPGCRTQPSYGPLGGQGAVLCGAPRAARP